MKYIAKKHLVTLQGIRKPGETVELTKEQAERLAAKGLIEMAEEEKEEKKAKGKKDKADDADKADKADKE